jgi:glycosyltransferase involved in cell wall biosynthesis
MKNPKWLGDHLHKYETFDDVPQSVFDIINTNLDKVLSPRPLASVVICAYNEEANVLKTISSLSRQKTQYPFEIVVINNNSNDKTQQTLDKLHIKSFFQPVQGWGPARQMGLEKAQGKYLLTADADAIYPVDWLQNMVATLERPGTVCVYGRYSFIAEKGYPRWQLSILEAMKDVIAGIRHYKRPYLNAYGISSGVVREHALRIGYVMRHVRGEDGRMCFDLMKHGKVAQVKAREARVWTFPRTLRQDGPLVRAIFKRVVKEVSRLHTMFYPMRDHDTKTSVNDYV